ncbi:hypothetical protein IRP63_13950 (plasmid) [Clostridium botulinum]|uniref:hypothetical protein n=1 Tax=Clostridium botulinum TaxID=1491 RepID=UPI0006A50601|nr:hypothetical protein [Clostridium botulinum]KOC56899.1 hypothetical protein ADU89_01515 [Clostridium botulinum]KOC57374.1 hypothetical protein ADU90_06055 [Clostridium botulinum]MCD3232609.1 hypothetical protein [Clostridium botulinum D/C]MCD3238462.1 hypothetical protein [Clostridium botulinum D/C]MCD3266018.1 hypothetical protein [Clostridium botulinum D/C]
MNIKAIYILRTNKRITSFLNISFINDFKLKPPETVFIEKLISLQIAKGFDDWMILKVDDMSEQFDIPRPTLARYMQKLKQSNILIQEDFRSPLFKLNPNMICYQEKYK